LGHLIWTLSRAVVVPFSWHDARRYVNTALEEIRISPNWARVIRGRKVKGEEAPYSRPAIEQLRVKYRETVPALEFTSEAPAVSKEVEERLKALEEFKQTLSPEQREKARKAGYQLRRGDESKQKAKAGKKPRQQPDEKDCEDGQHCGEEFKQISEAELLDYLRSGWAIEYKLSDGQVIVKRAEA